MRGGTKMRKKGFTLIELLTVVVILGIVITLAVPILRNLTYNNAEKEYQYLQKEVHEAAKLYAKNYRGELQNENASCFNIPYETLLKEGLIEEEGVTCTGNVILEKRSNSGYNYKYYLTCKDETGEIIHQSEAIPLSCKGFSGKFKLDYSLYKDGETGQIPYTEGEWARYIYGEYNASSPYNYPIEKIEYSIDFLNWHPMTNQKQTYTNYNGNIFARAVDTGGNTSEAIRHLVRGDSLGPNFVLNSNENEIKENNTIAISIGNVVDAGVGVDLGGNIYSYDGVNWEKNPSRDFALGSEGTIYVKDKLGNIKTQSMQIIKACNGGGGNATESDILEGKTAWVNGEKIVGTMPNNGSINQVLYPGQSYKIPMGYHNGNGKITVSSLSSNTSATATKEQILINKTGWVNGEKVIGTMPNASKGNQTLSSGDTHTIGAGYHDGNETIRVKTLAEQTVGDATADNLPEGVVAWVNGERIVGNGADLAAWYQKGYEDGKKKCTANLTSMKAYFRMIRSGIQYQYLIFTVDTSKYTKLQIGNVSKVTVDSYKITMDCKGAENRVIQGAANQTIDISAYNTITFTIEIRKNATLNTIYLGEPNYPRINISHMLFE